MPQFVNIDLDMGWDVSAPASTDALGDALDYKAVSKRVEQYMQEEQFELVETAAEKTVAMIMSEFGVPWLRMKLSKPNAVTGSSAVGVIIERGNNG